MNDTHLGFIIVALVCIALAGTLVLCKAVWKSPPGTALIGFEITDASRDCFTLRTSFKPCEARVTNGQWTIHFKR